MQGNFAITAPLQCGITALGPVVTIADQPPTRKYVKPIICLGKFVHPKKGWKLDVTEGRMDSWVDQFNKMKANGVGVKLTRDHKSTADAVVGETLDVFRDGDWLKAIVEVRGDANIAMVEQNKDVSVEIDETLTDSKQNQYGECITAVSIVPKPIIPGQTGFKRIAAGMDDPSRPTLFLSTDGDPEMKNLLTSLVALAAAAGISGQSAEGMSEESAVKLAGDIKTKFLGIETEKTDLTKKLSASGKREPDRKYLSLAAKSIETEIESTKDILSDAGRKALKAELSRNDAGEFSKLLLSAEDEEQGVAIAERICKIIRENPAVRKGPKTNVQEQKHLSADGEDKPQEITKERLKELFGATTTGREILSSLAK